EVRIILAASPRCGLLNQSHTRFNELLVPFDSEVRKTSVPQNDANFGIGALAYCWSMMFSDLPSPAEASSQMTDRATGFAQGGTRDPLFGIMLYLNPGHVGFVGVFIPAVPGPPGGDGEGDGPESYDGTGWRQPPAKPRCRDDGSR